MTVPLGTQQDIRKMDARGIPRAKISRQLGVSRNTVAKYADMQGMSPRAPILKMRPHLTTDAHAAWMDDVLEADLGAPRKQRHTARRIFDRLVNERGCECSCPSASRYVARQREGNARKPRVRAALNSSGRRGLLRSTSVTSAARVRGPCAT